MKANIVIIAGAVRGDITAQKVEIRATGRVWGDVVTAAFATEEGAFLRGQIRMEDKVDIGVAESTAEPELEGLEANPAGIKLKSQLKRTGVGVKVAGSGVAKTSSRSEPGAARLQSGRAGSVIVGTWSMVK